MTKCTYCEADLTQERHPIIISDKIAYCNVAHKNKMQFICERDTNHRNSEKDDSQGFCRDCGISYAESSL